MVAHSRTVVRLFFSLKRTTVPKACGGGRRCPIAGRVGGSFVGYRTYTTRDQGAPDAPLGTRCPCICATFGVDSSTIIRHRHHYTHPFLHKSGTSNNNNKQQQEAYHREHDP